AESVALSLHDALPILRLLMGVSHALACHSRVSHPATAIMGISAALSTSRPPVVRIELLGLFHLHARLFPAPLLDQQRRGLVQLEIGRASCRERGEVAG